MHKNKKPCNVPLVNGYPYDTQMYLYYGNGSTKNDIAGHSVTQISSFTCTKLLVSAGATKADEQVCTEFVEIKTNENGMFYCLTRGYCVLLVKPKVKCCIHSSA